MVSLLLRDCQCSVSLPRDAVGYIGLQCVVFLGNAHYLFNHTRRTSISTTISVCIDKLGVFHANQTSMCLDPHLN